MDKLERAQKFETLLGLMLADETYLVELRDPYIQCRRRNQSLILQYLAVDCKYTQHSAGVNDLKAWLNDRWNLDIRVKSALLLARSTKIKAEEAKYKLLNQLYLNPSSKRTKAFIQSLWSTIPIYTVQPLDSGSIYPPVEQWVAEDAGIWAIWDKRINVDRLPDPRTKRRPMHLLDREKLQFDLKPDQSAVFVDKEGHLVMAVIRDFCKDERTVQWANSIVLQGVQHCRNVRVRLFFFPTHLSVLSCGTEGGQW